jgi:vitamin B12 transporter
MQNLRRSCLCASIAIGLIPCFAAPAFAQSAASQAQDLDQLVVTATRTARTQDETLAAVTVIDRARIERLQPASLVTLLRGEAGISIGNNGGAGKLSSVFLRGTEADHVLVLVDGVRMGSVSAGLTAFQDIPVEQIERIEIVRGPFSSLYGSEAIGGVIQIFTRRPQGAFAPHASLSAGSFGTLRASAGVGGKAGDGWHSLNAAHEHTDGIDVLRDNPANPFDDFALDADRDGYRNDSITAQAGYRFSDAWDADAKLLRGEGRNKYDGSFADVSKTQQQAVSARVGFKPSETLAFTLRAGQSRDLADDYNGDVRASRFQTRRSQGSLQSDIGLGERGGLLTLGFDWLRDTVDSSTNFIVDQRISRGAFGQWQGDFGAHALQLAARRDEDDQFGGKTTGSALWGWDVTDMLRVTASYGTAYKAPSFNDLYFPGYGNPNLTPETSRSIEVGLRGTHGAARWAVQAFETRIDDLIAYDATLVDATHPFGQPNNIEQARIRGVEVTGGAVIANWDVQTALTWLDPRNRSSGFNEGNVLPRRARQTARIDVDRRFGAFSVGGSVFAAGERFDNPVNSVRMGGYALVDLRAGWAFHSDWSLQAAVANAADRDYETAAFYRQPGRAYTLTVRYAPKQ